MQIEFIFILIKLKYTNSHLYYINNQEKQKNTRENLQLISN